MAGQFCRVRKPVNPLHPMARPRMQKLLALALFAVLAGPAALAAQTDTVPPPPPVSGAMAGVSLRPGDVLQVRVWREPDLSGEFVVDETGNVVLPLVGTHRVTDVPVERLRDDLLAAYGRFLRNPAINITPLRRVNVLGEVNKPGLYPVDPTVTLAGAIGLAGGANPMGDLRRIRVVRDGHTFLQSVDQGQVLRDIDIRSGDQIIVERRSWMDRNSTFIVSALLSVTSIITSIIISRPH